MEYEKFLETNTYDFLSVAVGYWRASFKGIDGWGSELLKAQKAIHFAMNYLNESKSPNHNLLEPKNYCFAHCVYEIPGIYDFEEIVFGNDILRFHERVSLFALDFAEQIRVHYFEWFNMLDLDLLDFCLGLINEDNLVEVIGLLSKEEKKLVNNKTPDEWPVEEFNDGTISNLTWKIIKLNIFKATSKIESGDCYIDIVETWVKDFNAYMDFFRDMMGGEPYYINIEMGNTKDFSRYIINNFIERIEYHEKRGLPYPLKPLKEPIHGILRTAERYDFPDNDIEFGRFLEWINIFNDTIHDLY